MNKEKEYYKIAVINYSTLEVDIINNVPYEEDPEDYLGSLGYRLSAISYMAEDEITINIK